MLNDRDHLELREVVEQFVELLLGRAVENEIGTEHKDTCRQNWKHLQRLKADDAVEKQVNLVDFQSANERIVDPRESCAQGVDAKLVHMVTDLRLVHLDQVLKQLAQADNRFWAVRNGLQLAEVLAEHCTEDKVALFLGVTDIAEWGA